MFIFDYKHFRITKCKCYRSDLTVWNKIGTFPQQLDSIWLIENESTKTFICLAEIKNVSIPCFSHCDDVQLKYN